MTYNFKLNFVFLSSILILIGSLGVVLGLIWPALVDLDSFKKEREQKKEEKLAKENLAERIKILSSQFDSLDGRLIEKVERAMPKDQNVPDVLIQLENMASESNLILDSVDFSPWTARVKEEGGVPGARALMANLVLKGDYPAFSRWLELFESNLRLFDIRSADFNLSAQERNFFTLKIKFLVYYQ